MHRGISGIPGQQPAVHGFGILRFPHLAQNASEIVLRLEKIRVLERERLEMIACLLERSRTQQRQAEVVPGVEKAWIGLHGFFQRADGLGITPLQPKGNAEGVQSLCAARSSPGRSLAEMIFRFREPLSLEHNLPQEEVRLGQPRVEGEGTPQAGFRRFRLSQPEHHGAEAVVRLGRFGEIPYDLLQAFDRFLPSPVFRELERLLYLRMGGIRFLLPGGDRVRQQLCQQASDKKQGRMRATCLLGPARNSRSHGIPGLSRQSLPG